MKAFPSTLSSAFGLINNWKNASILITMVIEHEKNGIAFAHIDENQEEKQKKGIKCQEKDHYSHSCPKEQSDTQTLLDRHDVENRSDEDEFTFFTVAVL